MKVGDRVVVTGTYDNMVFNNDPGVLLEKTNEGEYPGYKGTWMVEFDTPKPGYHSCGGKCYSGFGFLVPEGMIKLEKGHMVLELLKEINEGR